MPKLKKAIGPLLKKQRFQQAKSVYEKLAEAFKLKVKEFAWAEFGSYMRIENFEDGPVNIIFDYKNKK